jgi:hypothetical protein
MKQAPSPQFLLPDFMAVASWVLKHCCPYHRRFLETKIRFHHRELSPEWIQVEKESDRVISCITEGLEFLTRHPDFQEQFDQQRAWAKHFLGAKPLGETYKGYNLMQSGMDFFAFAPLLGGLEPALVPPAQVADWMREGKAFRGRTVTELKSRIDDSASVGEMVLLEQGYKGFNIIQFLTHFYGIAQRLGGVDLAQTPEETLRTWLKEGKCMIGSSPDELKRGIDTWASHAGSWPGIPAPAQAVSCPSNAREALPAPRPAADEDRAETFLLSLMASSPHFLAYAAAHRGELTPAFFALMRNRIDRAFQTGDRGGARRLQIISDTLEAVASAGS